MGKGMKRGIALLLSVAMIAGTVSISEVTVNAKESNGVISTSENDLSGEYVDGEEELLNTTQETTLNTTTPEEEILEGYEVEYFDLGEVETSAISRDYLGLEDGNVTLINGTATNWIDRLDLSGDAQVIKNLYNTLVEASDHDGQSDYLIEDEYFDRDNVITVAEITGALDGTYSEAEAKEEVGKVASAIFANHSPYMRAAYDAFDRDHPEVFWLDGTTQGSAGYSYRMTGQENAYAVDYTVTINFVLESNSFDIRATDYQSESAIKTAIAAVNARVLELVNAVSDKSTVEKITYFNEQLTKTNEYNTSPDLNSIGHDCRECTSALAGKNGTYGPVCEAYARAFKVLCDYAGIPCVLVDGQAKNSAASAGEAHMWNYVQSDGEWLAVDVTWNDPKGGNSGALSGVENDKWLLVYGNSEISDGMTFLESHPVSNQASVNGTGFINGPKLATSVSAENVYYVSKDQGQDTNSGTQEAPLKTLEKALEKVVDNGIIYILDDVEVADATNKDAPLVIEKKVSIEGKADSLPTVSLRAGGIILGADVTLKNIQLGTEGFLRPGIAANGHTLRLFNVEQNESLRPLQIYGGTFFDYSETGFSQGQDYGLAIRGAASNVVIEGGSYEAVYAGSTNGSVDLPVNINVAKGDGLTFTKGIYVGSTMKNPQNTDTSGTIPMLEKEIELSGTVNIAMQDFNHSGIIVDGVNEKHTVYLTTSGSGIYSFVVSCLDSLMVNNGTFVPAVGSDFGLGNNIPNVELVGSSNDKATLDLSKYITGGSEITVNYFTGSENAILILESGSTLTVDGVLSGKNIEFRASGEGVSTAYWNSEENPGYSGWIEYGKKYINSTQGDGIFVIVNPYVTQGDIVFTEGSSATTGWTTIEGTEELQPPQLLDFTPASKEVFDSVFNTTGVRIDVETEFSEEEEFPYLEFFPFDYRVTYTDGEGTVYEYVQQSSISDSDGYCQCKYTASTTPDTGAEVLMVFEPGGEGSIYIEKGTNDLALGTYDIEMIARVESGSIEKSFTLTVVSDNAVATNVSMTVPEEVQTYGDTIQVQAMVQRDSSANVDSGMAQLYINDKIYGNAIAVNSNGSVQWYVPVAKENAFVQGFNILKVRYLGTDVFAPSKSEATVTVDGMSEQEPLKIEGLPDEITYGDTVDFSITGGLGEGAVTYKIQGDGEVAINGNKLTATKVGTITIVVYKSGDEEYKEASSEEITIEILPAELKLEEITYIEITEAGKTLEDIGLAVKAMSFDGEAVEGTIYWGNEESSVPETTLVEANIWYTWNFEALDENYAVLSGTVMPYCVHQWEQNIIEEDTGITVTISCTEETHIGDLEVQSRHNCEEEKTYRLSYPKNTEKLYYTGEQQEATFFSEEFTEKISIDYEIWNGNVWIALEENEVPEKTGKYRASVTQLGKTAYIEYEIVYLETEVTASAPTEWVTEAVITAPEGFTISRSIDGEYTNSILITEESESETGTIVTYYLKERENGYITNAKTITVKVSVTGENPNVPGDSNEPGEVKVTYTVSFNDIDGSALYEARTINKGETVGKPEDPIKEGYKFLGWFEEGSETSYQFDNPVTSNLILVAKWLEIGDIEEEDQENLTEIQDKIWVAGVEDVRYDGTKHTFNLRVYDGNKLLISGKDYTISYKNNQNAYEYSDEDLKAFEEAYAKDPKTKGAGEFEAAKAPQVILKMKGDYSGTKYIYFRIHPLTIEENCFVQDLSTMYNAKKVQNPKPVVTWNGKTLKNGKDYTFEVTGYPEGMKECKEPGTYIVTITGKGNFAGTDTVNYIIADPEKQTAMSKVKVDSIKAVKYSDIPAQGAEPVVTVRDGNDILKLGEDNDYTVTYKNNQKVGTAYAVITGTGTKYVGSKTVSFKITGTPISKIIYDKKILSYEYTGEKIKPFETGFVVKDQETGNVLAAGEHFFVTYSKNVNKGTATMSLKGNEAMGYSGTAKIKFAITAKSVKNLNITFAGGAEGETFKALYMKGGSKPVMLVKDGKTVLKEGVDYTVSYKNNRKAAKANDGQKAPLVTIQGKGNYKDKDGLNFTIENKALTKENGIEVVAKDKVFKDKANAYRQSFKVYDADGVALSSSDYDAKNAIYEEVAIAEDGSVTVIRTLDKNSKVAQESTIRITVTGKGVYAGGSVSGIYRILKAGYDIGKATIQIQNQLYTGVAVEIISQDQFVKGKVFLKIDQNTKKDLELGKDFEVVEGSYKKNIKKGTAKVTFRGKGDFGGEKTVTFKIVQRNVNTNWWKEMAEKVF